MKTHFKKFHFQELDWVICFPDSGNQGKYLDYTVLVIERKEKPSRERCVTLGTIFDKAEFEGHFPHTVGFFKNSTEDSDFKPEYMEIRIIRTIEDFWLFLNALNL